MDFIVLALAILDITSLSCFHDSLLSFFVLFSFCPVLFIGAGRCLIVFLLFYHCTEALQWDTENCPTVAKTTVVLFSCLPNKA